MTDTIFALATPPGRSGVAVIRVSGPGAVDAASRLGAGDLRPRLASLRTLRDPGTSGVLDQALVIWFEAPASFTGEDIVEFQVHGSAAVVSGLLSALAGMPDARQAEPGEFTRRALMNGKMDLAQVEGLADLLVAETRMQAQQALGVMDGRLSRLTDVWRNALIDCLAYLEASIDFVDDDVPEEVIGQVAQNLSKLAVDIDKELSASRAAERIRSGFDVALVGPPNVGKSTLLNALAGRDVAITSQYAGTTRDVLEVRLDLGGLPVTVLDTAGIRLTDDPVEMIGIDRTVKRARSADLRVFVLDDASDIKSVDVEAKSGDIITLSKADRRTGGHGLAVSGVTGEGLPDLLDAIERELADRFAAPGALGHERQVDCVRQALRSVESAIAHLAVSPARVELAAADLRAALVATDMLFGRVDVEGVLDVIFSRFCLGK